MLLLLILTQDLVCMARGCFLLLFKLLLFSVLLKLSGDMLLER
jgi:hypothetical protein